MLPCPYQTILNSSTCLAQFAIHSHSHHLLLGSIMSALYWSFCLSLLLHYTQAESPLSARPHELCNSSTVCRTSPFIFPLLLRVICDSMQVWVLNDALSTTIGFPILQVDKHLAVTSRPNNQTTPTTTTALHYAATLLRPPGSLPSYLTLSDIASPNHYPRPLCVLASQLISFGWSVTCSWADCCSQHSRAHPPPQHL